VAHLVPHVRHQVSPGDGRTTGVMIPVVAPPPRREPMALLDERHPDRRVGRRLWLTNLDPTAVAAVAAALRLTRLPGVVTRDCAAVSDGVGLRDFAGRSFPGWHRHITLVSVAHLVAACEASHTNGTTVR
jgi:hypothetical protein